MNLPDPLPQHLKAEEVLPLEEHVAQQESSPAACLDIALYVLLMHAGLRSRVSSYMIQNRATLCILPC